MVESSADAPRQVTVVLAQPAEDIAFPVVAIDGITSIHQAKQLGMTTLANQWRADGTDYTEEDIEHYIGRQNSKGRWDGSGDYSWLVSVVEVVK